MYAIRVFFIHILATGQRYHGLKKCQDTDIAAIAAFFDSLRNAKPFGWHVFCFYFLERIACGMEECSLGHLIKQTWFLDPHGHSLLVFVIVFGVWELQNKLMEQSIHTCHLDRHTYMSLWPAFAACCNALMLVTDEEWRKAQPVTNTRSTTNTGLPTFRATTRLNWRIICRHRCGT